MIRAAPLLFTAGLALAGLGALRDFGDAWIARTDLPPVLTETSVEVVDRTGTLMRVFPVEDGRWRLAVSVSDVDPLLIDMLIAGENAQFGQPEINLNLLPGYVGTQRLPRKLAQRRGEDGIATAQP